MIRIATAAAALLLSAAPALAQSADNKLVLTFETGARTGMVMVALYDSARAFNGEGTDADANRAVARTAISAQGWGYAVFGKVISGTEVVDKIKAVKTSRKGYHDDVPVEDVVMEKAVAL